MTAIDADSKLIVSWLVGGRDAGYASEFMQDVAERLSKRERDLQEIVEREGGEVRRVRGEREVGRVGSSVVSPRLGPIGLALVRREDGWS